MWWTQDHVINSNYSYIHAYMPTTTTYYSRGVHGHKNKNNAPQILKTQKINHEI